MNTQITLNAPTVVMNIFSALAAVVSLYSYAIIAKVLLSWLPNVNTMYDQYGRPIPQKRPVYEFLAKITDPYMSIFKSRQLSIGRIDYSPLFALMVLNIVKSIFQIIGSYGRISILLIVAVIIQNLWSYVFSYFFVIIIIMLAVRWYLGRNPYNPQSQMMISQLDRILNRPVGFIFKLFYKNRTVSDQKLVVISLITYAVLYVAIKYGCRALVSFLITVC